MPKRSRLTKNFQKKSRNTLLLSILGIAVILFLLFRYGIPLISDVSFLFGRVTSTSDNKTDKNDIDDNTYLPPPNLYSKIDATKEKTINITGTAQSGSTIIIYLNGNKEHEVDADNNGDFTKDIELTDGENIIKAKTIKDEKESDFSDPLVITFKKEGPELTIDFPSDSSQIKGQNPVEIKGNTDPDSSVIVNDFQAITNSNGNWSYYLTLKDGDNEIKVVATDKAGNKTEKIIHVNYSR